MNDVERLLTITQLASEMQKILGEPVHPDRIRRRLKAGLPHHKDRMTGFNRFRLSEVLGWWTVPAEIS